MRELKFNFYEKAIIIYVENRHQNNRVFIKIGNRNIKTSEVKNHVGNIITFLKDTLKTLSKEDSKYEKYSTVLEFLESAMGIFRNKEPKGITIEIAKIVIDVVKEIAFMGSLSDGEQTAVKLAANSAKFFLESLEVNY